jgi:hypothetical protein
VRNSGSGSDEFIITYDNNDNWDVSVDIYDLTLDAGDSQNIKIGIMPSESASDGQESPTIITVTAASDSEVSDSLTLITTAKEPEPDFDFSIIINEQDNDNYDYSSDSFIIKDREPLEITFTVTNLGNEQNAFNLKFNSIDNAFSSNFDRSSLSSVSPDQNEIVVLTLTPRNDYYGTNTFVEIEVTSAGDSKTKMETIEIFLEQSGNIIGNSNLKLETSLGKSLTHTLKISNLDIDESNRIYFGVSGEAETWVTFKDKDGDVIAYSKFLTLLPAQLVDITLLISVPSYADTGSYEINIWMENDQKVRISEQYTFKIVATSAEESTESNVILYGVSMIALGGVLLYGYRNFNSYDDEDYEDYDELEDIPEFIDDFSSTDNNLAPQEIVPEPIPQAKVSEPIAPSIMPETAPLALSPEVVTQSEQLETPVKPKKKWFGLFGKSDPVPDVQPVAAEPVMAQPVAAEPVMAQPVAAEPVMAQPVAAEPVMAQPVAAEPVMAQPVVAEPVMAQPVAAEPVMAQPVVAEPVVAQPVAAEPIVVQAVAILPEDEV